MLSPSFAVFAMGENDDGNSSGGCNGSKILDGKAIEPKAIVKFDDPF